MINTISIADRFKLVFHPMHILVDEAHGDDYGCTLYVKYMDGRMYVLKEEYTTA